MTLEKDKEDQSKYYFSYPKPPVLDMKSANRDINVAEWADLSALYDLVTAIRPLELFFVTYYLI